MLDETIEVVQDEQPEAADTPPMQTVESPEDVQNEQIEDETAQAETEDAQAEDETTQTESETGEQAGEVIITGEAFGDITVECSCACGEYIEALAAPRPFLTTPFNEYTVTEGFNLLFLAVIVIAAIYHMVRRFVL